MHVDEDKVAATATNTRLVATELTACSLHPLDTGLHPDLAGQPVSIAASG
jgi:hypothetical protein